MRDLNLLIIGTIIVQSALGFSYFASHMKIPGTPKELIVLDKDNDSQIRISLEDILVLKLDANPSTGYRWDIAGNNANLLKLEGEPIYEPQKSRDNFVGTPECQVFRFMPQQTGEDILELHYIRPWEKKTKPLKTFTITIQIYKN